jgi:hypothetical protein
LRRLAEGGDVGAGESIGDAQPCERKSSQRGAHKRGKPLSVRIVIFLQRRIQRNLLAQQQTILFRLVEIVFIRENRESRSDGTVEKKRLGEAERVAALKIPQPTK